MGFSVVAATGVVGLAIAAAGFAVTFSYIESQATLQDAQAQSARLDGDRIGATIGIVSVNRQGAFVTVTVTNTGSSTLDVSEVDLLVNGVPKTTGVTRQVDGKTTDVWPPASDLTMRYNGALPNRVGVSTTQGTAAYWGA
ncbi:MAG: hypothetical protein QOD77_1537 [Thermoplasmata archaeon]|jgi:flagellar protein FlaF|nr:hypothetical protein [Thermoplasmata archaeon]